MSDFLLVLVTAAAVPLVVRRAAARSESLKAWRTALVFMAFGWLLYALFSAELGEWLLGVAPADAVGHERFGRQIASRITLAYYGSSDWDKVWYCAGLGNKAYRFWLGWFYWVTGCTERGAMVFNAFMGWWGMVTLLAGLAPKDAGRAIPRWLLLITVLLPSAVFWTSANLKEGLALWAICQIVSATLLEGKGSVGLTALSFTMLVLLRPHVAAAWVAGLVAGLTLGGKRRKWQFLAALGVIVATMVLESYVGVHLASSEPVELLQKNYELNVLVGHSPVTPVLGDKPIPVVSGLFTLLLRPFLWEGRGLRAVLAASEAWILAFALVYGWWKTSSGERHVLLGRPEVVSSLVVLLVFAFLYTYMGNLGLLARQRLQVYPALIILVAAPRLWREHLQQKERARPRHQALPAGSVPNA